MLVNNYLIGEFRLQCFSLRSIILPVIPNLLGLASSGILQACMSFPLKDLVERGKQGGSCAHTACSGVDSYLHKSFKYCYSPL